MGTANNVYATYVDVNMHNIEVHASCVLFFILFHKYTNNKVCFCKTSLIFLNYIYENRSCKHQTLNNF